MRFSSKKDASVVATDITPVTTLLESPVSVAGIARFKDESDNVFTSIIIHEDTEHVSRLPKEVPVKARFGFILERNVGLVVVMLLICGELYETWWNYHNPAYHECFNDIIRQEKILLSFYIDSTKPARVLWVPNTLKDVFEMAIEEIQNMEPWTMNDFDVAREILYRKSPDLKELWENLAD